MSFPSAGTPTATQFASSVTSMSVSMPATVSSGDRLIAAGVTRYTGTYSTVPSGWTQLKLQAGGSSVSQLTIFEKIADGSEGGGSATWVFSTATTAVWQVIRVTGAHASAASEVASTSGDYTTNPNPPSLTPSWGADDTLWLEIAGNSADTSLTTGASTNYSGYQLNSASTGGAQANVSSASYQHNASSEDPGLFTAPANIRYWAAATLAVRPSAGGGGGGTPTNLFFF